MSDLDEEVCAVLETGECPAYQEEWADFPNMLDEDDVSHACTLPWEPDHDDHMCACGHTWQTEPAVLLEAAEPAPGTPAVPLDTLALGDVVTVQPYDTPGVGSMTFPVVYVDAERVVLGPMGKMFRQDGRLGLDSTGDLFDVTKVERA